MDDMESIVYNPVIQSPTHLLRVFTSPFVHFPTVTLNLYRPLTTLTLALNYWASGAQPDSFHLINRLLHVLTCLGIFWTVRLIICKPPQTALFSALLFAVHPIQTEAITYISGRSDALVTLCFIFAWYFFVRLRLCEQFSLKLYLLSMFLFLMTLLSKENGITWLGVIVLTDLVYICRGSIRDFLQRLRQHLWRLYAGYLVTALAFLAIRFAVLRGYAMADIPFIINPLMYSSSLVRVLTGLKIMLQCIGFLFWPRHLSCDYSYNQIPLVMGWNSSSTWLVLSLTAVALAVLVWSYRRLPLFFFAFGYFLITYSIVSNLFFPIGTIRADRLLYLPSLGVSLLTGSLLGWLDNRATSKFSKGGLKIVFVTILLLLTTRTILRNRDWNNQFDLFTQAVQVSPRSAKVYMYFGSEFYSRNEPERALVQYRISESIYPDYPDLLSDIGAVLESLGRTDEAITYYHRALAMHPGNPQLIRNNLGIALLARRDLDGAIEQFDLVIRSNSNDSSAHFNKAYALQTQGKIQDAINEYGRALEIDPTDFRARNNINFLLQRESTPTIPSSAQIK